MVRRIFRGIYIRRVAQTKLRLNALSDEDSHVQRELREPGGGWNPLPWNQRLAEVHPAVHIIRGCMAHIGHCQRVRQIGVAARDESMFEGKVGRENGFSLVIFPSSYSYIFVRGNGLR